MSPIKVLVCDSQPLIADALALALAWWPLFDISDERPASGSDAVEAAIQTGADVVVLDYWMPDIGGPPTASLILEHRRGAKVVMTSWLYSSHHVTAALQAGAVAFLPKDVSVARLAEVIEQAHAGKPLVDGERLATLVDRLHERSERGDEWERQLLSLTPREIKILELLSFGWSNDEIARELEIKVKTVKNYVQSILNKTGARSRSQVCAIARGVGLLETVPHAIQKVLGHKP